MAMDTRPTPDQTAHLIDKYIGTNYEAVQIVAQNIEHIKAYTGTPSTPSTPTTDTHLTAASLASGILSLVVDDPLTPVNVDLSPLLTDIKKQLVGLQYVGRVFSDSATQANAPLLFQVMAGSIALRSDTGLYYRMNDDGATWESLGNNPTDMTPTHWIGEEDEATVLGILPVGKVYDKIITTGGGTM